MKTLVTIMHGVRVQSVVVPMSVESTLRVVASLESLEGGSGWSVFNELTYRVDCEPVGKESFRWPVVVLNPSEGKIWHETESEGENTVCTDVAALKEKFDS